MRLLIRFFFQIEDFERQLGVAKHELETRSVTLQAELEHGAELEKQLKNAYNERIEMAKKCLEKDDEVKVVKVVQLIEFRFIEVSTIRREIQEAEDKIVLLTEKNKQLLKEAISLREEGKLPD